MIGDYQNMMIVEKLIYKMLLIKRKKVYLNNNYGNNIFQYKIYHILVKLKQM